jgi:hypothetical protein
MSNKRSIDDIDVIDLARKAMPRIESSFKNSIPEREREQDQSNQMGV